MILNWNHITSVLNLECHQNVLNWSVGHLKPYIHLFVGSPMTGGTAQVPRMSTSMDPGSRPSAAQPQTELSMATCPRSSTMYCGAACENGCAVAWGMLMMMILIASELYIIYYG